MFSELLSQETGAEGEARIHHCEEEKLLYVMMSIKEHSLKNKITHAVAALNLPSAILPSVMIQMADKLYLGYLYFSEIQESRALFLETLRGCLLDS